MDTAPHIIPLKRRRRSPSQLAALILIFTLSASAQEPSLSERAARLDADTQTLKREALRINRELFIMEEEILHPAPTQLTVFVTLDVGQFFTLDAVQLKLDGKLLTSYLYTQRELSSLQRGGAHRLHIGNVDNGEHELIALLTGKGPEGRDYRRGATLRFVKGQGTKYVELRIVDDAAKQQPEFVFNEW